ncbi:hypothetical protein CVE36_09900 [Pseudomonas syringae pv. actinidiae]|nr:hypothetical protein [Pseudomonas syringae pv. actinidiae]
METVTNQLAGVQQAAVIAEKQDNRVKELVLFVHLSSDTNERRDSLRRDLAQQLPAYMVPRVIRFTGPFPLTLHGKNRPPGADAARRNRRGSRVEVTLPPKNSGTTCKQA